MNIEDAIIEETTIEERELTEEEQVRARYERALPEDYAEDTIYINKFFLTEMEVDKEAISKEGNAYVSSKCTLFCYIDEDEVRVPFFIQNFDKYNEETGNLTIAGKNVLARLIRKLKGNTGKNRFKVDFEILRKIINETSDLEVSIIAYVDNKGYKQYTIE